MMSNDFNPAKFAYQFELFKTLFASKLKLCSSILDITMLLVIDNNNLMTIFLDLLNAF